MIHHRNNRCCLSKMNINILLRSFHQTINSVPRRILSTDLVQSMLSRKIHCACDSQRLNYLPNNSLSNNVSAFLQPTTSIYNSICGMKVKGQIELRCKDCYFVWRKERLYVMCKTYPRHKQTQMKKKEYKTWILTSASQNKVRGW